MSLPPQARAALARRRSVQRQNPSSSATAADSSSPPTSASGPLSPSPPSHVTPSSPSPNPSSPPNSSPATSSLGSSAAYEDTGALRTTQQRLSALLQRELRTAKQEPHSDRQPVQNPQRWWRAARGARRRQRKQTLASRMVWPVFDGDENDRHTNQKELDSKQEDRRRIWPRYLAHRRRSLIETSPISTVFSASGTVEGVAPKSVAAFLFPSPLVAPPVRRFLEFFLSPPPAPPAPSLSLSPPTDLYVLVHGLGGKPEDLNYLRECILERDPTAIVHLARCNSHGLKTFDGVRPGGLRLATEIRLVVQKYPSLKRISMVGNSLGGIYCRYAVALLYDPKRRTIAGLKPNRFLTTATPHLGVGVYGYLGTIPEALQRLSVQTLGITGRTIQELMLFDRDEESGGRPLLAVMAGLGGQELDLSSPIRGGDGDARNRKQNSFLEAMGSFKARCAYANAVNDFLVAYRTALPAGPLFEDFISDEKDGVVFRRTVKERDVNGDPFAQFMTARKANRKETLLGSSPSVPLSGTATAVLPPNGVFSHRERKTLSDEMARTLASLGWEQVSVRFPGTLPLAHNKICALARDPIQAWLNAEGRPVVQDQAKWLVPQIKER